MEKEIDYDTLIIDDVANKIISKLSFILMPSQRNEIYLSLKVSYKHGRADGFKEALEIISDAT